MRFDQIVGALAVTSMLRLERVHSNCYYAIMIATTIFLKVENDLSSFLVSQCDVPLGQKLTHQKTLYK